MTRPQVGEEERKLGRRAAKGREHVSRCGGGRRNQNVIGSRRKKTPGPHGTRLGSFERMQ